MPPVSKPTVKSAADLEAERAAQAAAEEGSSPAETEAAATEAAEQEVRQVAPGLSDEQVEKIAAASGKAAAQETIAEIKAEAARQLDIFFNGRANWPKDNQQTGTKGIIPCFGNGNDLTKVYDAAHPRARRRG